jgi:oligoendopeptidase F
MAMELLASPYLSTGQGGFIRAGRARFRITHLERILLFWPYMAVVDAFQHWVYKTTRLRWTRVTATPTGWICGSASFRARIGTGWKRRR